MISLSRAEPFAVGNNRACYRDAAQPDRCLKVLRSDLPPESGKGGGREGGDDNELEFQVLTRMQRRLGEAGRRMFPVCHGFEETDLGRALVTELCTDRDGSISLTLDHVLDRGAWNEGMARAFAEFKRHWIAAGVRSRQLRMHNLVVQEAAAGEYRICVIDGLGQKGGVLPWPFCLLMRWKARKKLRALERRMERFTGMAADERADRMRPIVRRDGVAAAAGAGERQTADRARDTAG